MSSVLLLSILLLLGVMVWHFKPIRAEQAVHERRVATEEHLPSHDVLSVPTDQIKKVVLDNGLTVLVCQQGTAPKVLVQIAYNVGSSIEQEGERGLAHLLEHMIFKGTEKLVEGDIDAIARKYGADFNAFTSHDMTSYYFESDASNWQHFLPVLADCMQNARFNDQHLASEVKAVIQELRMYNDSSWDVMVEHAFTTLFPANHPYHHPIIGYKEDLADISGAKLKAFYDKYYHPSRAVLAIVGDVDIDEAVAQAKTAFDAIQCRAVDHTPSFIALKHPLRTCTTTIYQDVQQEQVGLYWRIPGREERNHALVSAVEYVLGGGLGSRLYRHLVDELQIASSVRVSAEQLVVAGIFIVHIQPKEGKREACIQAVTDQLKLLIEHGCTERELYKMVKNRQRQHMLALHNLTNFTYGWLESYFDTGSESTFFEEVNDFTSVTSEQVQAFCAEWLSVRDMYQITIAPLSPESRPLWQQEQKKVEEYYAYLLERHSRTEPLAEPEYVNSMPAPTPLTFHFPQPTRVTRNLSNNLTMITYKERSLPMISVALVFKQASYFARSLEGVAVDIMMALLLERSEGMSKADILENFDLHGAQYGYNVCGMSFTCGRAVFRAIFSHAMHVLTKPRFSQESFEKLKSNFIHAYRQKKDSAKNVAMRTLKQAIYHQHPYGWSLDEAIVYLENLTLDDIKKLHEQYVTSAQMVLSVAGDIEPSLIEQTVIEETAGWEQGCYTAPVCPAVAPVAEASIQVAMLRDQTILGYGKISTIGLHDPSHIVLDLLNHICFDSLGSRLFELRERTGLFYTASGGFAVDIHQEPGFDYVLAIVNPENVAFAGQGIRELIDSIAEGNVTSDELASAKQMYAKELIDAAADVRAIASTFANLETNGMGFDYYDKSMAFVHDVDLEKINEAAQDYVTSKGLIQVAVGRNAEMAALPASSSADDDFEDEESAE